MYFSFNIYHLDYGYGNKVIFGIFKNSADCLRSFWTLSTTSFA